MSHRLRRLLLDHLLPLAGYLTVTLVLLWPLLPTFNTVIIGHGDVNWGIGSIWQTREAVFGRQPWFFAPLLYYPQGITMFANGLGPISGIFALPFWPWGPAAAYNGSLVIGFTLTGYCMYLLARDLVDNPLVAWFAGLLYTLAPLHLMSVESHLSKVFLGAIPLALLGVLRTFSRPHYVRWAIFTGAALLLAFLQSSEQLIYAAIGAALLGLYLALFGDRDASAPLAAKARLTRLAALAISALVFVLPLLVALVTATRSAGIGVNNNLESFEHQPDLVQFFVPYRFGWPLHGGRFDAWLTTLMQTPLETAVYLSWLGLALCILALLWARPRVYFWVLLLSLSFLFALGPTLKVLGQTTFTEYKLPIILPYAFLTSLPGFDYMRNPGRFMLLGAVGLAAAAALGLDALRHRLQPRTATVVTTVCIGLLLLEFWPPAYATQPLLPTPNFYKQIAADPDQYGVLDLPIRPTKDLLFPSWDIFFSSFYQLDQIVHGKGIATGYVSRFYARHPVFAQFISENAIYDSPIQNDMRVDGEPISRYANLLFELARNNYRYVVVHKPQPDFPGYTPGAWGEQAARTLVHEVFGEQQPVSDDKLATVYAVPTTVTTDTLRTSLIMLEPEGNQGWKDERWGLSPAPFLVHSPHAKLAQLAVTANSLWTMDTGDYFEYATLTAESGDGAMKVTTQLGLNDPAVVPVALRPGSQVITLTVTPVDAATPLKFAITRMDLRTAAPGPDSPVGAPLPAAPGQIAALGPGWHPAETDQATGESWRWASSPATLWLYNPPTSTLTSTTLSATPVALHVPGSSDGKGPTGEMRIQNGSFATTLPIQVGQPFSANVELRPGWNAIDLSLAAGNFKPVDLQPATGDGRLLSFALANLHLQAPAGPK